MDSNKISININEHLNYNNLSNRDLEQFNIKERKFIYKKLYYEFIDPYPYILNHPVPLTKMFYYLLYFLLLFLNLFKFLILKPFQTIKNLFIKKTTSVGVEENTETCSLSKDNQCVDFKEDKEEGELIIKTESFYFSHKDSLKITKQLMDKGYNIIFLNTLSDYFRIKLRIEYIINPKKQKENKIDILFTTTKIALDIINFEKTIIKKIKKCYNNINMFIKNKKKG